MTVKWNNALYVLENIARRYARTKWQNVFAMNGIFNPIWPGGADLPPSSLIKVKYYRFNAVEFFIADFSNLFSVPDFSIQGTSHIDQLSWALFDSFSFGPVWNKNILSIWNICCNISTEILRVQKFDNFLEISTCEKEEGRVGRQSGGLWYHLITYSSNSKKLETHFLKWNFLWIVK